MTGKRVAIYGAGGFGKEVSGMLDLCAPGTFAGFIDDFKKDIPLINEQAYSDVLLAIADPIIRHKLVKGWNKKSVPFTSFLSLDILLHHSVTIGKGCIICPGAKLTVDINIGQFVIINLNATIGHDVTIGDFTSIMPSVNISGNVKIGKRVFIGSGATILQGLTIGDDVVIGAGAVVTENVPTGNRVKGVPAKPW
jgi:sugar O-acyltransferase (sialic acid O-acetyltransferase NeuD family)